MNVYSIEAARFLVSALDATLNGIPPDLDQPNRRRNDERRPSERRYVDRLIREP